MDKITLEEIIKEDNYCWRMEPLVTLVYPEKDEYGREVKETYNLNTSVISNLSKANIRNNFEKKDCKLIIDCTFKGWSYRYTGSYILGKDTCSIFEKVEKDLKKTQIPYKDEFTTYLKRHIEVEDIFAKARRLATKVEFLFSKKTDKEFKQYLQDNRDMSDFFRSYKEELNNGNYNYVELPTFVKKLEKVWTKYKNERTNMGR